MTSPRESPTGDEEASEGNENFGVAEKLAMVAQAGNPFLNLASSHLAQLPEELMNLKFLQYLYMSYNNVQSLPLDFFAELPNLRWVDLRVNQLKCLPCKCLDEHERLEYLLLEQNKLTHLPIKLGYTKHLRGLSLAGNPLEFPHAEVIADGVHGIKRYLREVHEGRMEIEQRLAVENEIGRLDVGASSLEEQQQHQQHQGPKPQQRLKQKAQPQPQRQPLARPTSRDDSADQLAATTQLARLHQPHSQIRQQHLGRKLTRQSDKHSMFVNLQPEPPAPSLVERRAADDRRKAKRKEMLEKQEAVLQRRRDAEATRQWKEEAKKLQMARAREQLMKSAQQISGESDARITGAPFNSGWDKSALQLPTAGELEQHRWEGEVPLEPRPQPISAEEARQIEALRRQQEKQIAQQIQQHTDSMLQRKRQQQQQLSAAQEIEAARRDMEIAMQLQRQLAQRRATLEHRLLGSS